MCLSNGYLNLNVPVPDVFKISHIPTPVILPSTKEKEHQSHRAMSLPTMSLLQNSEKKGNQKGCTTYSA